MHKIEWNKISNYFDKTGLLARWDKPGRVAQFILRRRLCALVSLSTNVEVHLAKNIRDISQELLLSFYDTD